MCRNGNEAIEFHVCGFSVQKIVSSGQCGPYDYELDLRQLERASDLEAGLRTQTTTDVLRLTHISSIDKNILDLDKLSSDHDDRVKSMLHHYLMFYLQSNWPESI